MLDMDTDSFVIDIKTDDFYKDISNDVDKWFDTSNYDKHDNRSLEIGKKKKVIGKFKDELGGKVMSEFCALRAKTYYLNWMMILKRKKLKEQRNVLLKERSRLKIMLMLCLKIKY